MTYVDLKRVLIKQEIKQFEQFAAAVKSINMRGMVPYSLHDTEIDKIRKSEKDYNFVDLSAYYGCEKMFEYFLQKVPKDILLQSSQNFPLIFYALKGKNDNIINSVIQIGNENEKLFNLYDALYFSLKFGDIAYLNKFFDDALKERKGDDPEIVLYDLFDSPDHKPRSPLKLAIKSQNIMCVAFILNISQKEIPLLNNTKLGRKKSKITPLHVAARYGCGDIAYLFITLNPKMITRKGTDKYLYSFLDAVKYNLVPLRYDELFKHGPIKNINTPDLTGNNALHYAIKNGNFDVVQILLNQNNIDINAKGEEGKTPIHFAAKACSLKILTELLNKPQIDLLAKDDYDNLALHEAAEANWGIGFLKILEYTTKKIEELHQKPNQISRQPGYTPNETFENQNCSQYLQPNPPIPQINTSVPHSSNNLTSSNCSRLNSTVLTFNDDKNVGNDDNKPDQNTFSSNSTMQFINPTILASSANLYINNHPVRQNSSQSSNMNSFSSNYSNIGNNNDNLKSNLNTSQKNLLRQSSTPNIHINTVFQNNSANSISNIIPDNDQNINFDVDYAEEESDDDFDVNRPIELAINYMNKMGLNCFHIAAIKNCVEIFKVMETEYPSINEKIFTIPSALTGFTILHYLAMCGHDKLLGYILGRHSHVCECIDIFGKDPIVSPLYLASKYNQDKCVRILRLFGASKEKLAKRPRSVNQYIHYPFMQALLDADKGFLEKIKLDNEPIPSTLNELINSNINNVKITDTGNLCRANTI